jgi:hypothetical protein
MLAYCGRRKSGGWVDRACYLLASTRDDRLDSRHHDLCTGVEVREIQVRVVLLDQPYR